MTRHTPGAPKKEKLSPNSMHAMRVLNRELNKALIEGPTSPAPSTPSKKTKAPKRKGLKPRNSPKPRAVKRLENYMTPPSSPRNNNSRSPPGAPMKKPKK